MKVPQSVSAYGKALIVEDDDILAEVVGGALAGEGFQVVRAITGADALVRLEQGRFEVVVLDLMLPFPDGMTILRRQRASGDQTPILLMSAKHEVEDRIGGLDAGADDYLVKPFRVAELVARVRALLRRVNPQQVTNIGALSVDWERRQLVWKGSPIQLTNREFAIFALLARKRGQVVSQQEIATDLLGAQDLAKSDNLVEVNVTRLRRKLRLAGCPDVIRTIRGSGYRLADELTEFGSR